MRILGLDVGTKRIGISISDALGIIATPIPAIQRDNSSVGNIKYARKYNNDLNDTVKFVKNLNRINQQNKSLQTGEIESTVSHPLSWVHASYCVKDDNKIYVIKNFSDISYYSNYLIVFPEGKWTEIINSDSSHFGGEDKFLNKKEIVSDGINPTKISLPDWGITAFKNL